MKIYLAGPDVFLPHAMDIGRRKQVMCREFGFEGLFPLDNDDDVAGAPAKIFRANRDLMRQADIGLFNCTPFRGPSTDAGTAFEIGFLSAAGKPLYGYRGSEADYRANVVATFGPVSAGDRPRDRLGLAVENFGLADNLMLTEAIRDSGGTMIALEAREEPALAAFEAFRACLERLRSDRTQAHVAERTR